MKTATKPKLAQDQEFAAGACEVSIFMACFGLVNELKAAHKAFQQGGMNQRVFGHRFNSLLHQLCFVAESTARFDILLPVVRYGQFSPSFWRWFNWWDEYLVMLSHDQIWSLREVVCAGDIRHPCIHAMRPPGDWLTFHATPPLALVST